MIVKGFFVDSFDKYFLAEGAQTNTKAQIHLFQLRR